MRQLLCCLMIGLLAASVAGPSAVAEEHGIRRETRNGIACMSGGVGREERDTMEAMSGEFNLKVVLADAAGDYLARLPVIVDDAAGRRILEVETRGPWFFARLPAGRYTVKSVRHGDWKEQTLPVDDDLAVVIFHWRD